MPADDPKLNYYLRQLESTLGKGNFDVVLFGEEGDVLEEEEELEEDYWSSMDKFYSTLAGWTAEQWVSYFTMDMSKEEDLTNEELLDFSYAQFFVYEVFIWPRLKDQLPFEDYYSNENVVITEEPIEIEGVEKYPESAQDLINELHETLHDPYRAKGELQKGLIEIEELIKNHPNVPVLYNYKYSFLNELKMEKEAIRWVEKMYQKFPDYLFAKCDYIIQKWDLGEKVNVEEVFGNAISLPELYPKRTLFHISELFKFNQTMMEYHLRKDQIHHAYFYFRDLYRYRHSFPNLDKLFPNILLPCMKEFVQLMDSCKKDESLFNDLLKTLTNVKISQFNR